ncbi:hypothetical protein [Synechococcus sp. CBW1004]|uniref:hypothetical protein n=1 Tax=Synechococcus sp. CBW1004 TaxID=1353136 RepID=UPI0018CEBE1E|nr:hypothetical protein [Synechococcus sp. CBW1004]QPN65218.1 hypothetical protein H8F25_02555 [Synechococcus sp. CBW1004]
MSGSSGQAERTQDHPPPDATPAGRFHLLPLVLLILAVLDLRTELVLLVDHVTLTSLATAITAHPLAIAVLLAQPSLWRRYGRSRR